MVSKTLATEVSNQSLDHFESFTICRDNVDEESIATAIWNIKQKVPKAASIKTPKWKKKKDYQEFLIESMLQALTEYWRQDASLTNENGEPLWKTDVSNSYVTEYQADVEGCSMRVVRQAAFNEETFSANFVTFTTSKCKPDIALEISCKSADISNAILIIEVKFKEQPQGDEVSDNLRQLVCYMVTFQRPVVKSSDGDYLLYGLLLYPSVAYQVELKSHVWLSYPWKCVSIREYSFDDYYVMDVLRAYIRAGLGGGRGMCKDELFKMPHELNFPRFPEGAVHKGVRGNVVKVKWGNVSENFLEDAAQLESEYVNDEEVVVKVVSPTIYPNSSLRGCMQVSQLYSVLTKIRYAVHTLSTDKAVQKRLQSVANMYIHIGPRGNNSCSNVVVTRFKGEPLPTNTDLMRRWQAMLSATATTEDVKASYELRVSFFNQVCLVALDFVQFARFAHYDIRLANIVFTDDNFALIDWEDLRSVISYHTNFFKSRDKADQRYPKIGVTEDVIRWLVYSAYQLYMVIFTIDMAACAPAGEAEDEAWDIERAFRCEGLWQQAEAEVSKQAEAQSAQPSTSMGVSKASGDVKEKIGQHSQKDALTAQQLLDSHSAEVLSGSIATEGEVDCFMDDDVATLPATVGDSEGDMTSIISTDAAKNNFQTDKESATVTEEESTAGKPEMAQSCVDVTEAFVKWCGQREFTKLCNFKKWNEFKSGDFAACRAELHRILKVALQIEV